MLSNVEQRGNTQRSEPVATCNMTSVAVEVDIVLILSDEILAIQTAKYVIHYRF